MFTWFHLLGFIRRPLVVGTVLGIVTLGMLRLALRLQKRKISLRPLERLRGLLHVNEPRNNLLITIFPDCILIHPIERNIVENSQLQCSFHIIPHIHFGLGVFDECRIEPELQRGRSESKDLLVFVDAKGIKDQLHKIEQPHRRNLQVAQLAPLFQRRKFLQCHLKAFHKAFLLSVLLVDFL